MPPTMSKVIAPLTLRAKHVGYTLANGIRCVIVQDPNAKLPATAMCIAAGQLNDPVELPGLAHFCEHMLFMGTEKFPKEDEYDSYISKNNGFSNAFTADRATVYYFQVSDEALDGALARFVEFFVSPSFNESAVNREVQAVHSEDEKNHSVDYWRNDEIYRGLYNEKHPRSRYGNGNLTTLSEEPKAKGLHLREELKRFYNSYYFSGAASIVVYSAREPAAIIEQIEKPLLRMRVGQGPSFHFIPREERLFMPSAYGSWLNVKTVKKARSVSLRWPVRSSASQWKTVPSAYISHVVGHECDSSVLGVLKKRNWATAMVAGASKVDDDFEMFFASIDLTEEGLRHVVDAIAVLYEYIGLAVNNGVNKDVYNQMKAEERLGFESQEVDSPSSHCTALAMNVADADLEHCLIGGSVVLEDDLDASLSYARQLTPENAHVSLNWGNMRSTASASPGAGAADAQGKEKVEDEAEGGDEDEEPEEEEEKEGENSDELFASLPEFARRPADTFSRFHRANYSVVRIPEEQLAAWHKSLSQPQCSDLKLPAANPFLATDLTIFPSAPGATAVPESFSTPHGVAIIRKDANHHNTFNCSVALNTLSPVAYASPLNRIFTQVMCSILRDSLTELSYFGELASLSNTLSAAAEGPSLSVSGPYQHLPEFLFKLLEQALLEDTLRGTKEKFESYCESYLRKMKSRESIQPYEHALERLNKVSLKMDYTFEDILAAAPSASYDGYLKYIKEYLRAGLLFECFVAGNVSSAKDIVQLIVAGVEKRLDASSIPVPDKALFPRSRDSLNLKPNNAVGAASALTAFDVLSFPPFNPEDSNVCALLDVYVGESSPHSVAIGSVASKMISSLFFNALRTKESLGYVVFSQFRSISQGGHLIFLAQSAVADVDGVYLLSRIVAFLRAVGDSLDKLCTQEELDKIVAGLVQGLEKLPNSVQQDVAQLNAAYVSIAGLESRKKTIEALHMLTVEEVRGFFTRFIANERTDARALAIVVNNARTSSTDPFAQTGGKIQSIRLPAQRRSPEDAASPSGEEELALPTFDDGKGGSIETRTYESIDSYRQGRDTLQSHTF